MDELLPKNRIKQLCDAGCEVEFSHGIPVKRYVNSANEIYRMAMVYQEEGDLERAFMLFNRYCTLIIELIPKHPEYKITAWTDAEKSSRKQKTLQSFNAAEKIKKSLTQRYEEEYRQAVAKAKAAAESTKAPVTKPTLPSPQAPATIASAPSAPLPDVSGVSFPGTMDLDVNRRVGGVAAGAIVDPLPPAYDGLPASSSEQVTMSTIPRVDRSLKPTQSLTETSLRRVIVPGDAVEQFMAVSEFNTNQNIETCGILCGKLGQNRFVITHILVPEQTGSSDSCTTNNEAQIFEFQDKHDLITLGWIHTHPSQTAFLSSVDMHTQCSYQLMLPEAIAIVGAPKYNETGIFNLTPDIGLQEIGSCRETGFHPHSSALPIFQTCEHAQVSEHFHCALIDMR